MWRCMLAQAVIPKSQFKARDEDFYTTKIVTSRGVSVTATDL